MADTSEDRVLPRSALEVVDLLNEVYPERSADRDWSDRDVWIKSGERNVVRYLIELRDRLEESLILPANE